MKPSLNGIAVKRLRTKFCGIERPFFAKHDRDSPFILFVFRILPNVR